MELQNTSLETRGIRQDSRNFSGARRACENKPSHENKRAENRSTARSKRTTRKKSGTARGKLSKSARFPESKGPCSLKLHATVRPATSQSTSDYKSAERQRICTCQRVKPRKTSS